MQLVNQIGEVINPDADDEHSSPTPRVAVPMNLHVIKDGRCTGYFDLKSTLKNK